MKISKSKKRYHEHMHHMLKRMGFKWRFGKRYEAFDFGILPSGKRDIRKVLRYYWQPSGEPYLPLRCLVAECPHCEKENGLQSIVVEEEK